MEYDPNISLPEVARMWDDFTVEEMFVQSMTLVDSPHMWPEFILNVANETIGVCRAEFQMRCLAIPIVGPDLPPIK